MRTGFWMVLTLALAAGQAGMADAAEADAKEVVARVVAAAGGEEKLLKLFQFKERLNVSSDPDKKGNERVSVLEAPKYWWIGKGERGAEPAKFLAWGWTLGAVTDPTSKVEVVPDVKEEDKVLCGLRVSGTVNPPMELYFEQETHRLVRIDWRSDIHRLSDWRDRDGVKYPAKCVGYKKATGKPWYFTEILELTPLKELPDGLKR